jgi:L-seryl-tRNA(Ser) seleniumtransferase
VTGVGDGADRPDDPSRPPSIDRLARSLADLALPHPLLVDAARAAVAAGDPASARDRAQAAADALLRPVINATGVLLHTNLGRAPVAVDLAARYQNVELDLASGRRGSRRAHAAGLIARIVGAEAAVVVNNGAAAVLLVLSALAAGQRVVTSRGELVEIGGGFRIPDVLASSGAELVEVGTTNRTRLADYLGAIDDRTALVLKVHQSNYRIVGFTEAVDTADLAELGPPVVYDIGSGLVDRAVDWLPGGAPAWLRGEPAARQTLAAGAGLVTFSTDKLFGGPQGGVIAGRADLVDACARHPLARALRPGGLVLAALQATALAYLRGDGLAIPFWRMAAADPAELARRAAALGVGTVVECRSLAGGGSLPGLDIPSAGVAVDGDRTAELRRRPLPIVARVLDGRTVLDLRTVEPADDPEIAAALRAVGAG